MAVGVFDAETYLQQNPDVATAVQNGQFSSALQHYLLYGAAEGRDAPVASGGILGGPQPAPAAFDQAGYFALYPDVAEAAADGRVVSGLAHFLSFGQQEGRLAPLTNGELLFAPVQAGLAGPAQLQTAGQGGGRLTGTGANDVLLGGAGDDVIEGRGGQDVLAGAGGGDVLSGGTGQDRLYGSGDVAVMIGGEGNDQLIGGGSIDAMFGEDGHDVLIGGAGLDVVMGNRGHDFLDSGAGPGLHAGGEDPDIFNVGDDILANGATDIIIISDFTPGEDRLSLSPALLGSISTVVQGQVDLAPVLTPLQQAGLLSEDLWDQLNDVEDGDIVEDSLEELGDLNPNAQGQILANGTTITLTTGDQLSLLGLTAPQVQELIANLG